MNDTVESDVPAAVHTWLASPMDENARLAIERVRRAEDVTHVAVMPDVHLAGDVCVGTAMATRRLIYPAAVGGDIGCGMLAIAFNESADALQNPQLAGEILRAFGHRIPAARHHRSRTIPLPPEIDPSELSHPLLRAVARDAGHLQFGTLGGGNHFVELQSDDDNRLWVMIHSGSRAMGQEIKATHLTFGTRRLGNMIALDAANDRGQAYLHDQKWARKYAHANRIAIGQIVCEVLANLLRSQHVPELSISCDHNHVQAENHFGQAVYVHRKGAMPADVGQAGVVPGSMGTLSMHVEGRGRSDALRSSAHGAGRLMARGSARDRFAKTDLRQQMHGVWFDPRLTDALREESPKAYKDLRRVMRAQSDLVTLTRTLRPLLVFKGR